MTATVCLRSRMHLRERRRYMVGGQGRLHAYADTMIEAKDIGGAIAKRELLRGSWNVAFITVPILEADAPGSTRYVHTGWRMYVPVRGTGSHHKAIVERIRKHHGVSPLVWTKN